VQIVGNMIIFSWIVLETFDYLFKESFIEPEMMFSNKVGSNRKRSIF